MCLLPLQPVHLEVLSTHHPEVRQQSKHCMHMGLISEDVRSCVIGVSRAKAKTHCVHLLTPPVLWVNKARTFSGRSRERCKMTMETGYLKGMAYSSTSCPLYPGLSITFPCRLAPTCIASCPLLKGPASRISYGFFLMLPPSG